MSITTAPIKKSPKKIQKPPPNCRHYVCFKLLNSKLTCVKFRNKNKEYNDWNDEFDYNSVKTSGSVQYCNGSESLDRFRLYLRNLNFSLPEVISRE
jgi:hypothetical protein